MVNGLMRIDALLLGAILVSATAACATRPSMQFSGDGKLLDFGSKESIVRYQLLLTTLSTAGASQKRFKFSGIPTNYYWFALIVNEANFSKCDDLFDAKNRDKGIDLDFRLRDEDTSADIVPITHVLIWRVSYSSPAWYDTGPPTRRCVLYPDKVPHVELNNSHKYTLEVTIRQMELAASVPISIALEGKGRNGEL